MGRKGKAKKSDRSFGKSLQKSHAQGSRNKVQSKSYEEDGIGSNLESVLQTSNLEEFLANAALANRQFDAQKERMVVLDENGIEMDLSELPGIGPGVTPSFEFKELQVPRRPPWDQNMSKEKLESQEKEAFLEWRRIIASHENTLMEQGQQRVTPFEKNLEVWRQLWRVMERSDVVVQIVDCRNPLFYYTRDLEVYSSELVPPRPYIVLVNKADYLTDSQRLTWSQYFNSQNIKAVFFSAHNQQEILNAKARAARGSVADQELIQSWENEKGNEVNSSSNSRDARLFDREELCSWLVSFVEQNVMTEHRQGDRAVIGMVGYPNVGKSSVINVLAGVTPFSHGSVRVGVAATPGKTKHFQTLNIDVETTGTHLTLCDCPGLVFPSFVSNTAEMICAGVLRINEMRDHKAPVALVSRRVPRKIFEMMYGLELPVDEEALLEQLQLKDEGSSETVLPPDPPTTAKQLLDAFCTRRGFMMAGSGNPDGPRGARILLTDYIKGRLLYCHPPPNLSKEEEDLFLEETLMTMHHTAKISQKMEAMKQDEGQEVHLFPPPAPQVVNNRHHTKKKKWGKKGKKLRNKNPYEDEDGKLSGSGAHTTGKFATHDYRRAQMPYERMPDP